MVWRRFFWSSCCGSVWSGRFWRRFLCGPSLIFLPPRTRLFVCKCYSVVLIECHCLSCLLTSSFQRMSPWVQFLWSKCCRKGWQSDAVSFCPVRRDHCWKGYNNLSCWQELVMYNNNNGRISRAPFDVKHAQLCWTGVNTKIQNTCV